MFRKARSFIMPQGIAYLIGCVLVLGIKYFYSNAGSDELRWILAPTAGWVRILSGIPFEYESQIGYVNHAYRFIIAASCSGVQFLIVAAATLLFSYVHRMKTRGGGVCWLIFSFVSAYLFTVFVNGLRIIAAIFIPLYLSAGINLPDWITPGRLHTMIGIAVYFTALLIIYYAAGYVASLVSGTLMRKFSFRQTIRSGFLPVFWYFFILLGIPLANQAYRNHPDSFLEYAALMIFQCLTILLLFHSAIYLHKKIFDK